MTIGSYTSSPPSTTWRKLKFPAGVAVAVGDLLYVSDTTNNVASPAGQFPDMGTAAASQRAFASLFAGLSNGPVVSSSNTGNIVANLVLEQVVTDYPCESATFVEGDLVAVSYSAGTLAPQKVVKTTDPTCAVGKVTKAYASAATAVEVWLFGRAAGGPPADQRVKSYDQAPCSVSTGTAGSAAYRSGGDGCYSAAGAGSAGGSHTAKGGNGGATTGGTAGAGAQGITKGGDGGAATTGTPAAGAAGVVQGGAGGAASAGSGNGGNAGAVLLVPGTGGTSFGGTAGVNGMVLCKGPAGAAAFGFNGTRSTISNGGTVSDAQHRGMVLYQDASGGSVTMTTRTGSQLDSAFPDAVTGTMIPQWVASNHASNTSTVSGGSSVTLVGSGAVTQLGGSFLLIKTGTGTWDLVRVG